MIKIKMKSLLHYAIEYGLKKEQRDRDKKCIIFFVVVLGGLFLIGIMQ